MSEDLDSYKITPSDLGQDPENDPGVVEEAIASAGGQEQKQKQPIPKCFSAIPFEVRKKYRKLWDSFEIKDMSFEDFAIELYCVESPTMMQQDLGRIIQQKQTGNRNMAANLNKIRQVLN